jgi:hypothetical protein
MVVCSDDVPPLDKNHKKTLRGSLAGSCFQTKLRTLGAIPDGDRDKHQIRKVQPCGMLRHERTQPRFHIKH